MEKELKAPKLRFPGFTDDWEQRKLEDMASFSKGSGYSKSDLIDSGTPLILYGRLYTKYETVITEVDTYAEEKKGSVFSKGGEVIVPASGETAEDISVASVVEKSEVLLGGDLNVITPSEVLESMFLALNITYGKAHKDMSKLAQGKSVVHLHNADLKTIVLQYPSILEQRKICEFFKSLDNLITLHQRKLDTLKKLKKGFLQKMFPKNGESVPEIRFPGFTDAWEQRKLGNIANFINGRAYSQSELQDSGKYKILRVGNFYTNDSWYYSDMELDEKFYANKGDLLYTWSATFGPHIWDGDKVIYHYHIWKIELANSIDKTFAIQLLEKDKANILSNTNGSTMIHITKAGMEEKIVTIPAQIEEQMKIGSFLDKLDNLITLHQRKLDTLKKFKQGMLQQMFI